MKILKDTGIFFEEEKVLAMSRDGVVVGETIAEAALADDRNSENPLLVPYREGGERSDNPYVNFFWDYCSQGKPAYLPVSYPSFEEAQNALEYSTLLRKEGRLAAYIKDMEPEDTTARLQLEEQDERLLMNAVKSNNMEKAEKQISRFLSVWNRRACRSASTRCIFWRFLRC